MWDSCYISNTNNNSCIAYGIINSTAWCYSTSANSINYNYSSLTIMCDISSYSSYSSFSSRYSSSYSWVIAHCSRVIIGFTGFTLDTHEVRLISEEFKLFRQLRQHYFSLILAQFTVNHELIMINTLKQWWPSLFDLVMKVFCLKYSTQAYPSIYSASLSN